MTSALSVESVCCILFCCGMTPFCRITFNSLKSIIGFGVGAGANVMARYEVSVCPCSFPHDYYCCDNVLYEMSVISLFICAVVKYCMEVKHGA